MATTRWFVLMMMALMFEVMNELFNMIDMTFPYDSPVDQRALISLVH